MMRVFLGDPRTFCRNYHVLWTPGLIRQRELIREALIAQKPPPPAFWEALENGEIAAGMQSMGIAVSPLKSPALDAISRDIEEEWAKISPYLPQPYRPNSTARRRLQEKAKVIVGKRTAPAARRDAREEAARMGAWQDPYKAEIKTVARGLSQNVRTKQLVERLWRIVADADQTTREDLYRQSKWGLLPAPSSPYKKKNPTPTPQGPLIWDKRRRTFRRRRRRGQLFTDH